tara:strand:+ start:246 stop:674 length:429 start_codon:yes stop_codon:yes gene_type:complete
MKTIRDTPGRSTTSNPKRKVNIQEIDNTGIDTTAINYCEEHYPATCNEFKKIMKDQYEMFCKKQKNYGPSNISVGTNLETNDDIKLSLTGLWFRMNDKIQRLKQLIVLGHKDEVGESEQDTFQDLSIYGIIAQIVTAKKWGK